MGLEAINFVFRSEEPIEYIITSNNDIIYNEGKKYIYKKHNDYWIDMEIQDMYSLSIRIALCNPTESVLIAFSHLLSFLFGFKGGVLIDIIKKQIYKFYNDEVKNALEESYLNKKMVFESMYGNYTAAIGSEEFYRVQEEIKDKKNR